MTWTLLRAALVLPALAAPAHAGSDHRWHDRFFWGLAGGAVDPTADEPVPVYGFEVSYWYDDHLAVAIGTQWSAYADDWGVDLLGALPLRYVQLYGGPHLGVRDREDMDGGVHADLHLTVGIQAYLGRNGRLFVQYQDLPGARLGPDHADVVMAGLRWSPDFFHRARPLNKIDMVYEVALLTFVVWGLGSVSQ